MIVKNKAEQVGSGPEPEIVHPYRELIEHQGEGIGLVDTNEVFIFANPAAEKIFGVGRGQLLGRSIADFLDEENLKLVRRMTARRLEGARDSYLLDVAAADGVRRTIRVTAVPQKDSQGKVVGAYGIFRDVTAEVSAQRQLARSEKILRAIIESTADGILVIGQGGEVLHYNSQFLRIWHIPEEMARRENDAKLLQLARTRVADPDAFLRRVQELYRSSEKAFDVFTMADGRTIERYSQPLLLEGKLMGRVWSFRDVTARVEAERGAVNQAARLTTVISAMPEGVLLVNGSGMVVDANDCFCRLAGRERSQVVGAEVFSLFDQPLARELRGLLASLQAGGLFEARQWQKPLFERELVVRAQPICGLDQENELLLTCNDVTDIVRARRAAEEASRVKSDFVATMSHEVRTPLNGMLGMMQLLAETNLDEEQNEFLQAALASANTLRRLLDDLLDFSRLESGRLEILPRPFDVRRKVTECLKSFWLQAREKGLDFEVEVAPEVPPIVVADGDRLCQVVANLVSNALRFTDSGRIAVQVGWREEAVNSWLDVSVGDTGIGIAPADREKIFQSFTQLEDLSTRRQGGAGLGLAICRHLVELMGGTIDVTENPGGGSRFSFVVPVGRERQSLAGTGKPRREEFMTGTPALPLWNRDNLLRRIGGDEQLLVEMLAIFAEQAPATLDSMRQAWAGRDPAQLARGAHSMKGAALNVAAERLAEASRRLEAAAREGQVESLERLLAALEAELEGFLAHTRRIVENRSR